VAAGLTSGRNAQQLSNSPPIFGYMAARIGKSACEVGAAFRFIHRPVAVSTRKFPDNFAARR